MAGIIAKKSIEEVRHQSDAVDVIGSYLTLKRAGATFKALCPFHKEKTPSFVVNQQRQIFHCFGCGEGGDVFKFVMLHEGVDFVAAVGILARRAGVALQYEKGSGGPREDKTALYEVLEQAAQFYHRVLKTSKPAEAARAYMEGRDLAGETVDRFLVGFAPDKWDVILTWARKHKHSNKQLEDVGLILKSTKPGASGSFYDRFRNRIMFPIRDSQGRVVGFSGRTMDKDSGGAKYVNTPETSLFRKGHILYGLYEARKEIVNRREAVLCEGQIDVIRCHHAGITNAVAAQGTAFTEDHARIIKRAADAAVIVFDPDTAGQDAAVKSARILMQAGLAVRIADLPDGQDPDTFIRTEGVDAFRAVLERALPAVEFQVRVLRSREDTGTEVGLVRVSNAVLETVLQSPNAVQRSKMIQLAARLLNVPVDALEQEMRHLAKRKTASRRDGEAPARRTEHRREEMDLAAHIVTSPQFGALVEKYLPREMFADQMSQSLVFAVIEATRRDKELVDILREHDDDELARFAARAQAAPDKSGVEQSGEDAVKGLILFIRRRELNREKDDIDGKLQSSEGANEDTRMRRLEITHDLKLLENWDSALPIMDMGTDGKDG
jgi:DNA primase